ncbi:HET-domain-containing protein [Thozetella sp. PMI_491]|nr:HET-domain-containing protein [Thozetella sp. PMI_491]
MPRQPLKPPSGDSDNISRHKSPLATQTLAMPVSGEALRQSDELKQLKEFMRGLLGKTQSGTTDKPGWLKSDFDSTSGSPVEGTRRFEEEWISISKMKAWIQGCNTRHGLHCQAAPEAETKPYWLIDTSEACLVKSPVSAKYVALSYVWGSTTSGLACKENLDQLQTPGCLLDPSMPRTIRDVIELLRVLGERYLWVDRLCIIQDDDKAKEKHIRDMANIYSHASLTVVVAIGDCADHGLRGIPELTPGLDPKQRVKSWSTATEHQLTRLEYVPHTKWYSRGWTLQEIVFSRRTLYFTEHGAFWECHCHSWSERTSEQQLAFENTRCNDKFADIFRDSYFPPGQIFISFAGITTSLGRTFQGGFLYGLPEMFLDVALLWRPFGPCRRRTVDKDAQRAWNQASPAFPSWSWIGWQTNIDPRSWKCGYDYIKSKSIVSWPGSKYKTVMSAQSSWQLKPTVKWYVADAVDSPVRPVIDDYKRHQRSGDLPKGWSRYALPFEGPEETTFAHISDSKTRFHFPLPLASDFDAPPPSAPGGPFLYCQTTVGSLLMDQLLANRIVASLYTDSGAWAGVVRMQVAEDYGDPEDFEDMVELPEQHGSDADRFREEFIVISEGRASNAWNELSIDVSSRRRAGGWQLKITVAKI